MRLPGMMGRVALLTCVIAGSACAIDVSKLQPRGYVSDFAGVMDAGTVAQINEYCGAVERATGAQFAVVTVKSLEGDDIDETANKLFHQWGVGKKGTDEGLMVLLAVEDHKYRAEVGLGLEGFISDGSAGGIMRGVRPLLRQADYGNALFSAVHQFGDIVAQAKGVTISGEPAPRRGRPQGSFPFGVIVFGVFILFIILSSIFGRRGGGGYGGGGGGGLGNLVTGMILGNILSGGGRRGGGGWDGGGFGGGGGGGFGGGGSGGFGGFGGGDSGGGGASGGW